MTLLDADRYIWSVLLGVGLASVGSACSASFIRCSAASASSVQRNLFFSMHPLSVSNNGMAFSTYLEMKQVSVFSLSFRTWASLSVCGDGIFMSYSILVGLG